MFHLHLNSFKSEIMSQRRGSSSKAKGTFTDIMVISDISSIVQLPSNTDINEWFAVHIVQFYNELSLLCSIIRHNNVICNESSCPTMSAGEDYEYLWHSREFIQPIAVSAPKYIDFLLEWIEEIINDKHTFPRLINSDNDDDDDRDDNENKDSDNDNDDEGDNGNESENQNVNGYHENKDKKYKYRFPSEFKSIISKMCRRIVRVFGHIYYIHYQEIQQLKMDTYLNTSFQYFLYFIKEFKLVKDKELYPIRKIVRRLYISPSSSTHKSRG